MSKLSYEDKINIYIKKKNGQSRKSIATEYKVNEFIVVYLYYLIDKHGYDILRTSKNKYYPSCQKEQIMNRVLINDESVFSVAIDEGLLSYGMLQNWIKNYKENEYNIVERKRGRSTMPKKPTKSKKNETIEEKVINYRLFDLNNIYENSKKYCDKIAEGLNHL